MFMMAVPTLTAHAHPLTRVLSGSEIGVTLFTSLGFYVCSKCVPYTKLSYTKIKLYKHVFIKLH